MATQGKVGEEAHGSLKSAVVAAGKGVVGGWMLDSPFEHWTPDKPPWDGITGPAVGGHCMYVLDYPSGLPRVVSSWGPNKGNQGTWTFTWRALMKAMSLWVIDFVPL